MRIKRDDSELGGRALLVRVGEMSPRRIRTRYMGSAVVARARAAETDQALGAAPELGVGTETVGDSQTPAVMEGQGTLASEAQRIDTAAAQARAEQKPPSVEN